jgi:hypothetical protein
MSTLLPIRTLFFSDIERPIEEVIKVDQTDEAIVKDEIDEYVVTGAIRAHCTGVLEAYRETLNKPHEGIAVWVSGFFGSGKSSFAKMLGLAIENRMIDGEPAAERFGRRTGDAKIQVLLKAITEQIPTHAVIFDVSTDRGIRSGNQTLTEIMYGLFLQSLGYARDLDLSELEIALEQEGRLAEFERVYADRFKKPWDEDKGLVAFSLGRASEVMHLLEPRTYPVADSWGKGIGRRADISAGKLADRANELMKRRCPGKNLLFVIDEVGQFVARDVQKMLDLQAIVQNLGVRGRGKHWIVVTSQEKLGELVSGLDDKKIELARLMDRFPLQVHLEPSDISEVTSRRVLSKNSSAESSLGKLFDLHRARLSEQTRLSADIRLPELTRENFIDLYPLLPYQIDLIVRVVSGLRTQGGASRHVGGANRTIIKLAQQLLVHPAVDLASQPVGALVQLDQVYDLVEGNISSEIRAKIATIPRELDDPLAQAVAKVICLLQYVQSVRRSPENIAAALHGSVDGDSRLASVKDALRALEAAHMVRQSDGGYKIPTPAEDDWERNRNGINPSPGDAHRLSTEVIAGFWQPQPSHTLLDTKTFKAGLAIHGRQVVDGDMLFQVYMADDSPELNTLASELRTRSQQERKSVFWAIGLNDDCDQEIRELFRSREMLARRERERTSDESLVAEEKVRLRRHQEELKRLLRVACLSGNVYFQGKDRSPGDRVADVGKAAAEILAQVLPDVFNRFGEAAARSADLKKGLDALFSADNLQGLPQVFVGLDLLRGVKSGTIFRTDSGPLAEVLRRIEERASYGDTASGRFLADELGKEPFGWDFEAVRLFVLSLLRAGKIEAISKGQTIESATSSDGRDTFTNNNVFRQASFRPKKSIEHAEIIKASLAFTDTFGSELRDISSARPVAEDIRREVARHEEAVVAVHGTLVAHKLPGGAVLEAALGPMKAIIRGSDDNTIATFNASHRSIKEAIKRSTEIQQALSEPKLHDLERARRALSVAWPFLQDEPDLGENLRSRAIELEDLFARETFFRELPAIEQHAAALESEYARRFGDALQARINEYTAAYGQLIGTPGWARLKEDAQLAIAAPLQAGMTRVLPTVSIALLRSERDACDARLRAAVRAVQQTLDGDRIATVNIGAYFSGGIETMEQLDSALTGIRDECAHLIGSGKKVILP